MGLYIRSPRYGTLLLKSSRSALKSPSTPYSPTHIYTHILSNYKRVQFSLLFSLFAQSVSPYLDPYLNI